MKLNHLGCFRRDQEDGRHGKGGAHEISKSSQSFKFVTLTFIAWFVSAYWLSLHGAGREA